MDQQLRTIRLNRAGATDEMLPGEQDEVLIAAVGILRRAAAGQSLRETLETAGLTPPAAYQTLRVNNEEVRDLSRVLYPRDRVTIVNKVVGG
jgi:hypothetical protein